MNRIPIGFYLAFSIVGFADQVPLGFFREIVRSKPNLHWVLVIIIVGILWQMFMILLLAVSLELVKDKNRLNQKYLAAQEEHYHYLEEKEEETRRFRHDMRNHLYTLNELNEEGKTKEVKDYLHKIAEVVDYPKYYSNVGNGIVDAILNQYADMFTKRGIELKISGKLEPDCFVDAFDFCTIFSNILQNAMEAVERCEDKLIRIIIRNQNGNIAIQEQNSFTNIEVQDGKLISNKKELGHGLGIENIRRSVKRYSGELIYEVREGKFVLSVLLLQPLVQKK